MPWAVMDLNDDDGSINADLSESLQGRQKAEKMGDGFSKTKRWTKEMGLERVLGNLTAVSTKTLLRWRGGWLSF